MSTVDFSNYLESKLLGVSILGSSYTAPPTIWVALATSVTSDGDSITEVTTNTGYVRQLITFDAPSGGTCASSGVVSFPTATTPWGTVAHVTLMDSSTIGAGNCLYHSALDTSRSVTTNDTVSFADAALTVTLD